VHESLRLAIGQVLNFFKATGTEDSVKVFCEKSDAFAQAVWTLEKLSKCVLELRAAHEPQSAEHAATRHGENSALRPALSPETLRAIEHRIEGPDD